MVALINSQSNRSIFNHSSMVLYNISKIALESGLILSTFSICLIVSVAVAKDSFVGLIFSFPFGNVYIISLLFTLNVRSKGRRPRSLALEFNQKRASLLERAISHFKKFTLTGSRMRFRKKGGSDGKGSRDQDFDADGKRKELGISQIFRDGNPLVLDPKSQVEDLERQRSHPDRIQVQVATPRQTESNSGTARKEDRISWAFTTSSRRLQRSSNPLNIFGISASTSSNHLEVNEDVNQADTQGSGLSFWCRGLRSFQSDQGEVSQIVVDKPNCRRC